MRHSIYIYILLMALVTYAIRALPILAFTREIRSPFFKSFLYYVPYAALASMTFPAILTAAASPISGLFAFVVALWMAYRKKSLLLVALSACGAVFLAERGMDLARAMQLI